MGHPDIEYNTKKILNNLAADHNQWRQIAAYARKKYEQGTGARKGIIISATGEILAETTDSPKNGTNYRLHRHLGGDCLEENPYNEAPQGTIYTDVAALYQERTGIRTFHICLDDLISKSATEWTDCDCYPKTNGKWCSETKPLESANPVLVTLREKKDYMDQNYEYFAKHPAERGPMPAATTEKRILDYLNTAEGYRVMHSGMK